MPVENKDKVDTSKQPFQKPELKVLDVKGTQTSTNPNPTESPFHFAS